ncbi:MAG: TRAP transporter large permease [Rhodocyclaceae bacterium]
MALTILCLSFFAALVLGVPVVFAIGLSAVATILYEGLPMAVVFQKMTGGMQVFTFLAIPFFIMAGELMLLGGIADRIVNFAKALVGHVRGGLGMANVVACTLFGGVSGSPVADVSAMGGVLIPSMKREGYDADYAVNVTTHAALVGALMPTSHNIIIYTLACGGLASVTSLILAGIVPALILMVCNLAAAYYVAIKRGYPSGTFPGWGAVIKTGASSMPGLFVVVIIVVGILSGAFTATESASVAVLYALLLTTLVYRSLTFDQFVTALAHTVKKTGVVLALIGISATFGYFIAYYQIAELTGQALATLTNNPWMIFFLINIILFLLGTFLDMAPTILVCTPIFLPIAMKYGMDPVQFGIMMLLNCALGLNTPPVGTTQFIGCAIGEISVEKVMKSILPFYTALAATMFAVTFIPAVSMTLPRLFH